jgi:hypothetical protein
LSPPLLIAAWAIGFRVGASCRLIRRGAHAVRGERDQSFVWLERAYDQHDMGLTNIKVSPLMQSLRDDLRYKAFLRKMKLPE